MAFNLMKSLGIVAVILACGMTSAPAPAQADGLRLKAVSSKSRAAQFERQKQLMDSRLASQYKASKRLRPVGREVIGAAAVGIPTAIPRYTGRKTAYLPHAKAAAAKYGIPEDLFLRLIQQESGWNPNAVSNKGARGLAQLMPGTAQHMGVNSHDPVQNLHGGARYLRMMYNQFGDWRLALAAYNAGPGAVAKYGGIPPFRETRNYVRVIHGS